MTEPSLTATARQPPSGPTMIDRTVELARLQQELRRVVEGQQATAVLVVGACGVGKSRLVTEIAKAAEDNDVRVLRGQCIGQGAEALLPVREALASYLGSTPERIKQVINQAAPKMLELVPFVGRFLVPVVEAAAAGPQLGGTSVQGVYAGLERVLHGLAERTGLCLVIEDLHAADDGTLNFLSYFLGKAAESQALAVFTLDEDELTIPKLQRLVDDWTYQGWARVDVGPLPKDAVADYVTAVTGEHPSQQLVDRLYDLTAGNALLLEELLPLVRTGADADLADDFATFTLPRRVHAVLHRRLLGLSSDMRAFLEAAAVGLESNHEFGVVPHLLRIDEDAAFGLLDQSSRLGLLIEESDGRVRFEHEAMRITIYGDVPEAPRRRLHERAATWFEEAGRLSNAAHHYLRAGRTQEFVQAALRAAAVDEHVGMYHSAVALYERALPHADERQIGPRLARALIMLGRWDEAEGLLGRLPYDDVKVRLLWSDLHFVRGRIRRATEVIEDLLPALADRLDLLIRLADLYLYLGEFDTANRYADEALGVAEQAQSAGDRARCLGIVGAALFFGGRVAEAEERFRMAYDLLDALPDAERDRTKFAVILGNLGQSAETRRDWAAAEAHHTRALQLRREVFDARGVLHSTHALARVAAGRGEISLAGERLAEADDLAAGLGEPLEQAKITHTRARLAHDAGDHRRAVELAERALEGFVECGTAFDVAHAQLSLAQIYAAADDERRAVAAAAAGRRSTARKGFGVLEVWFPELTYPYADRIHAALVAYASADAYGLPWEGAPPAEIDLARAPALPARPGWGRGDTSDDTALTLLVAELLTSDSSHEATAERFLTLLSSRADQIRGLGPSTSAAIELFRATGQLPDAGGASNGAAMRALPVGWLIPLDAAERRRRLTVELSRATHPSPQAQCAACVMSACATWALEGTSPRLLLEIACEEAAVATELIGADRGLVHLLETVGSGTWEPPPDGVSLDPYETVAAVLSCVLRAGSLRQAVDAALALGGDTDTVAALTAGLLASWLEIEEVRRVLPWSADVRLPEAALLSGLAHGLAASRVHGGEPGVDDPVPDADG